MEKLADKYLTVEDLYERNRELKKEDVSALQNWMNKQGHLPKIDEFKLISFLHACYYKLEPTKTCIENFFTLRAQWPEFSQFRDLNLKENRQALNAMLYTPLPIKTKQDHVVIFSRLLDTDVDRYDSLAQLRIFDAISWIWYLYLGTTQGQVMVSDMEGVTFGHMMKANIVDFKRHMLYVQEALPIRLKGIHMINVGSIAEAFLNLVRPFMKKGMIDLIHLHSKIDTLYQYVPREALPKEYGGEAGSFKELHDRQIRLVEGNLQYVLNEQKEIADESKRQGKAKNIGDVFGIEGSFKKLDID